MANVGDLKEMLKDIPDNLPINKEFNGIITPVQVVDNRVNQVILR